MSVTKTAQAVDAKTVAQAEEVANSIQFLSRKSSALYGEIKALPQYSPDDLEAWENLIEEARAADFGQEAHPNGAGKVTVFFGGPENLNRFLQFRPMAAKESNVCWKSLKRVLLFLTNALENAELSAAITGRMAFSKADGAGNLVETVPTLPEVFRKVSQCVETFGRCAEVTREYDRITGAIKTVKRSR